MLSLEDQTASGVDSAVLTAARGVSVTVCGCVAVTLCLREQAEGWIRSLLQNVQGLTSWSSFLPRQKPRFTDFVFSNI